LSRFTCHYAGALVRSAIPPGTFWSLKRWSECHLTPLFSSGLTRRFHRELGQVGILGLTHRIWFRLTPPSQAFRRDQTAALFGPDRVLDIYFSKSSDGSFGELLESPVPMTSGERACCDYQGSAPVVFAAPPQSAAGPDVIPVVSRAHAQPGAPGRPPAGLWRVPRRGYSTIFPAQCRAGYNLRYETPFTRIADLRGDFRRPRAGCIRRSALTAGTRLDQVAFQVTDRKKPGVAFWATVSRRTSPAGCCAKTIPGLLQLPQLDSVSTGCADYSRTMPSVSRRWNMWRNAGVPSGSQYSVVSGAS